MTYPEKKPISELVAMAEEIPPMLSFLAEQTNAKYGVDIIPEINEACEEAGFGLEFHWDSDEVGWRIE